MRNLYPNIYNSNQSFHREYFNSARVVHSGMKLQIRWTTLEWICELKMLFYELKVLMEGSLLLECDNHVVGCPQNLSC